MKVLYCNFIKKCTSCLFDVQRFSRVSFVILLSVFALQPCFSYAETYSGQVVPLIKSTINSGTDASFNGVLKYVAKVGDILKPEITDLNGKVIEAGSPVLILNSGYLHDAVLFNQQAVKIAQDNFANAELNLSRNKKLIQGHEISEEQYQNYTNTYYKIKNTLSQAKYSLSQSKKFFKACFFIAPFECIVDQVLLPAGVATGQPPTIVISQLNPIGIKLNLSRAIVNSITPATTIKIYSMRQKEPIGIIRGSNILQADGIILQVYNKPEYGKKIIIDGKTLPVIKRIGVVESFAIDRANGLLGVPASAICRDSKGQYVWKGKGIKHMQANIGLKEIFSVEKVYVKDAGMKKKIAGSLEVIALQKNSKLQLFDVVLTEKLPQLSNNDLVYFVQERYQFMPGDTVKVVIGK